MRKINVRYRCSVCGVELRVVMAPDEEPPPPKHCLEEMDVIAPVFE
jgi:rubredoxin